VHLLYGGVWMEWDYFVEVIRAFKDFEKGPLLHMPEFGRMGRLFPHNEFAAITNIAGLRDRRGTISLVEALAMCRNADVTDLKDKVYAMHGVARTDSPAVDYRNSVHQVYIDTARAILHEPYALHLAGIGFDRALSVPSWVPDWSAPLKGSQGYLVPPGLHFYNACGSHTATRIRATEATIALPECDVDSIAEISDPPFPDVLRFQQFDLDGVVNKIVAPIRAFTRAAETLTLKLDDPYPPTQEPRYEAFWRTLLVNRVDTPTYPITEFGNFYSQSSHYLDAMLRFGQLSEADREGAGGEAIYQECLPWVAPNARFLSEMGRCGGERRFALTKGGYMAFVPPNTAVGDRVVIFKGARTPFLVRAGAQSGDQGARDRYQLVGECYVHGMMNGEVVTKATFVDIVIE
jgi:hypothetical protein